MSNIAKIIRSDGEEAVQLPPGFQFEGDTVRIRRDGEAVILEPIVDEWSWLEAIAVKLDPDVLDAILKATDEDVPQQDRPALDEL
ncbi:AbrB/MazE/SpoVT family DNA-binding domain-containing protein [Methylobacterium sp. WL30]|uniref:antitoxin n=1 Tax=unclassified Methylobacterium TaxID=2615210 RepID=UPI0011CBFAD5|nr:MULTISPECIES: AbrB/MazE/SpoVT family DNA-binding domain-containing protein [unclassified Methylobacterium]TXN40966.1 AbrB/MazE/SpoVT family DNA-binding domain-containing protein [Methylobacterium sp. WL93]TXN51003.1 AbrB/MazE/SpoVT family DNA-binding domain-containing protein [Methylobacterium sp. WL119]TXN68994.1 AbrB/MazE/SpoVT family DNA-binding domain-containing protein [Methylobacterium sp. WL30]